jgi:hypothetical protein
MADLPKPSDLLKKGLPKPQDLLEKKNPIQKGQEIGSEPLNLGLDRFQTQVPTEVPSVLTPKGQVDYQEQVKDFKPVIQKPISKPKTLSEAVSKDDSYVGAIWNQIPNSVSDFVGGLSKLVGKGAAQMYGKPVELLFDVVNKTGGKNIVNPIKELATYENIESVAKLGEKAVKKLRTSASSEEYERSIQEGFNVTDGVGFQDVKAIPVMLARLVADAGLSIPTAGLSFVAQGYNQGLNEYDEAVKDIPKDLRSDNAREGFGVMYGTINGLADKLGLDFITKSKPVSETVKKYILKEAVKELAKKEAKNITSNVIESTIANIAKSTFNKVKAVGVKTAIGATGEGITEPIQGGLSDGLKILTNKLSGSDVFDVNEIKENFWKSRINDAAGGFVLGGALGGAINSLKSTDSYIAERVAESTTPEQIQLLKEELVNSVDDNGNPLLDEEKINILNSAIDKYSEANQKLPAGLSTEKRAKALQLISERDEIKASRDAAIQNIDNVDEAIKPEMEGDMVIFENKEQQKNDEIREAVTGSKYKYFQDEDGKFYKKLGDGKAEEISQEYFNLQNQDTEIGDQLTKKETDAVQVETTGQVPVQPEAPVGEEVEQGKPEAEPKVVAEEGKEVVSTTVLDKIPRGNTFQERLAPDYYEKLKKDIKENGIKEPIILTYYPKDNALRLSDGHHRLAIAKELGITDIPTKVNVAWGKSIKDNNPDIEGQPIYNAPKTLDIESYRKRDYFPSNVRLDEIGLATKPEVVQEQTPAQKVEQLRAKEQAELKAAIPNADQYLTDGKVDRAKITDAKDLKKFDKIYDKYDKLITPRLKEAKADAEVAKLYALLGTPDGEPRFRLSDEVEEPLTSDVESIEKEMNAMPEVELNFTEPEVSQKGLKVDPVSESNSLVKIAKKVGDALLKPIQFFNGIPMITGMSDILSAGKIKDSTGKPMDVEGGLLFNVLGKNKNAAWAGVDREGAKEQYDNAVKLYNSNKELFDRLWSEGRLPDGHVPMAIMRMGNEAVNSNEAVFRWVLPTIEGLPKQNRIDAMNVFTETLQSKSDAITNKLNEFGKGKLSQAVLKELGLLNSTLKFIKDNKITDLGQFFKEIVSDSNKRAKGNSGSTLSLPNKTFIYNLIFAPKRIKTASKPVVKALLSGTDNSKNKIFTSDFIYSSIGEPSMLKSRQGEVVSIVGIDVKNGGVIKVDHGNYGFGPKGKTIALIENPTHGIDVFPEWKAKASRVFKRSDSNDPNKEGKYPSPENVATQTGGAFFGDSAMKGAKVFADVISDLNLLIGKLRYAFPSVSVSTTQEEFNNIINSPDVRTQVSDGKVILGLTKDGKIYLNPEMSSLQTPIHEFGHIWIDFLRSKASGPKGTAFLNKGLDLVRNTKEHKKAIEKYGDTEIALEEALVELMANKGATIISAAQRSNFLSWMNGVFKYIQQKFTTFDVTFKNKDKVSEIISKLTLDEFINIGLADLFSGKELSTKFAPELSESAFKARMSAITDINEIVKIGLDNGISIDSITKVLKDKNFNEKEISLAVYNAISKDIKLDESNVENAIELLDEIEDNKRKAERASSKRKADLEQKISEAETELDKIQEEAKIVKVINDNFDKIKKDLKEQGLLNVKC